MLAQNMAPVTWQARLGLNFAPSPYQVAVFRWVVDEDGHLVVQAVAGSGKTTTIVSLAKLLEGRAACVSFGKDIALVLGEKLQGTGVESSTAHALARSLIVDALPHLYIKVVSGKYRTMLREAEKAIKARGSLCGVRLSPAQRQAIADDGFPLSETERLLDLARLSLLDFDADDFDAQLQRLAAHHDLLGADASLWPLQVIAIRNCMRLGCEIPDGETGSRKRPMLEIDFTDMLWLPSVLGLRCRKPYDWLLVDECQDISLAARRMLMSCMAPRGRMIWVGDPRQAIMGFAGADAESFNAIIEECRATVLPLSVCYRCPTSHLELAREWCPEIEARTGAPVGTITTIERDDYVAKATKGDLVICRRNAPLLSLCFELIAEGKSATVRGRDIGGGLKAIVEKVSKKLRGIWADAFGSALDAWVDAQAEILRKRYSDDEDRVAEAMERIDDKAECIRVIWSRTGAASSDALCEEIDRMFSNGTAEITLSSVHRAKGLEAQRVGILEPERLQSTRATQDWQIEQEENLAYVAHTRAIEELLMIPGSRR